MSIFFLRTLSLLLLVAATVRDCSGASQASLGQATIILRLEEIELTLNRFADEMKETVRLHIQNVDALRHLNSLPMKMDTLTQEVLKLQGTTGINDEKVQDLERRLRESHQRVQELEQQNKELNNTVVLQKPANCTQECEQQQNLDKIKQVVQEYVNNRDWATLKEALVVLLDNKSEEYSQLQEAQSMYYVGYNGYTTLASLLVCVGLPVNIADSSANNMLHGAATGGQQPMVKLLLDRGASIDARDKYKHTPLILAAIGGQLDVVKYLVQAGADTTARDTYKYNAIRNARYYGHNQVVQYLKELPK